MGNFRCVICGAECSSKCPNCRSVFMDNRVEGMLGSTIKFSLLRADYEGRVQDDNSRNDTNWLDIKVNVGWNKPKPMTVEERQQVAEKGFESLLNLLRMMEGEVDGYPSIAQWSCYHKWEPTENGGPTIDCGCWEEWRKKKKGEVK